MVIFRVSYHIAGTKGIYYAREPYTNVDAVHITRFIGLASVGNRDKQVFLFVFIVLSILFIIYLSENLELVDTLTFSYGNSRGDNCIHLFISRPIYSFINLSNLPYYMNKYNEVDKLDRQLLSNGS